MANIDEMKEKDSLNLIREQISIKRNELKSLRKASKYGHIPFTELEKAELKLRLINLELLREKANASAILALQAEQSYKDFFAELASRHGICLNEDFRLPSKFGSGVKLVSAPFSTQISEKGETAIRTCVFCHTVCCWLGEDGGDGGDGDDGCSNCEELEDDYCTFQHALNK